MSVSAWLDNPFMSMKLKKVGSKFKMMKKVLKMNCVVCVSGRANRQCKLDMCKKCCMVINGVCKTHKKNNPIGTPSV